MTHIGNLIPLIELTYHAAGLEFKTTRSPRFKPFDASDVRILAIQYYLCLLSTRNLVKDIQGRHCGLLLFSLEA